VLTNDRTPERNRDDEQRRTAGRDVDRSPHRAVGRRRVPALVAAAGTTAAVALGAVGAPGTADAAERIASPAIAAEAARAVDVHERWEREQHPADYIRFVQIRTSVAELTASELGVSADDLDRTWSDAPQPKQIAVLAAMSQLGVPYERYESEPGVGFDCSGLTQWAYARAGVDIERSSRYQYRGADRITADEADPGDLVYYPGHIALYLGEGLIVHSPSTGSTVEAGRMFRRSVSYADPLADD
jgi:cell wall-associated NlpC family hydrolase